MWMAAERGDANHVHRLQGIFQVRFCSKKAHCDFMKSIRRLKPDGFGLIFSVHPRRRPITYSISIFEMLLARKDPLIDPER